MYINYASCSHVVRHHAAIGRQSTSSLSALFLFREIVPSFNASGTIAHNVFLILSSLVLNLLPVLFTHPPTHTHTHTHSLSLSIPPFAVYRTSTGLVPLLDFEGILSLRFMSLWEL